MSSQGHCPTCICGRRAPVQASYESRGRPRKPAGTVAWWEHEKAWEDYGARYSSQDAERIAERGGFGYWEMTDHLGHEPTTWSVR